MAQAEQQLAALKARMTEQQIKDMAEIVSNEVKRREELKRTSMGKIGVKSSVKSAPIGNALPKDELGEMYAAMDEKVRALRAKKSAERIGELERALGAKRSGGAARSLRAGAFSRRPAALALPPKKVLLGAGVIGLALLKVVTSMGVVNASLVQPATGTASASVRPIDEAPAAPSMREQAAPLPHPAVAAPLLPAAADRQAPLVAGRGMSLDRELALDLDARRVELEKRKVQLDEREAQVAEQSRALQERLGELRILTAKLGEARKESENQHEARLEQLAQVYGSMAPNEAAPLIGKLDEEISIALLRRLPGKRMGQILSAMEQDRAVHLTRMLTNQKLAGKLDVPE